MVEESVLLLLAARANTDQRTSPHSSAVIALNLGMAYALRIHTDNSEKFRKSRQEYELAADLFRQLQEPVNERRALVGAGGISYELADWSDAEQRFAQAINLLEGRVATNAHRQIPFAIGQTSRRIVCASLCLAPYVHRI